VAKGQFDYRTGFGNRGGYGRTRPCGVGRMSMNLTGRRAGLTVVSVTAI